VSPADALARLLGAGIRVTTEGDRLRLRGQAVNRQPELVELARQHKPALLALLTDPPTPTCGHTDQVAYFAVEDHGTLCADCWRRWAAGDLDWPELVAEPAGPPGLVLVQLPDGTWPEIPGGWSGSVVWRYLAGTKRGEA